MSSRKIIRIFAAALLLTLVWFFLVSGRSPGPSRNETTHNPVGQKTHSTLYPLLLGDRRLNIPGNFLTLIGPFEQERMAYTGSATLEVLFPGFQGQTPQTREIFEGPSRRNSSLVRIEVGHAPGYRYTNQIDMLKEVAGAGFVPKSAPETADALGLHTFRPSQHVSVIEYLYQAEQGQDFVARCTISAVLIETCDVDRVLPGHIRVLYHFQKTLLKDWRALDAGVVRLINMLTLPAGTE